MCGSSVTAVIQALLCWALDQSPAQRGSWLPQPWWLLRKDLLEPSGPCWGVGKAQSPSATADGIFHGVPGQRQCEKSHFYFCYFPFTDCSHFLGGFSALQRAPKHTDPTAGCLPSVGHKAWSEQDGCWGVQGVRGAPWPCSHSLDDPCRRILCAHGRGAAPPLGWAIIPPI